MLPKKYRLLKNKDFHNVFKRGKGFKERYISLRVAKNNLLFSRFGFVVSNKVSKKSVERHKIKRRLNEIMRFKLPKIKKGFDVVIVVQSEIINKTYQQIEKAIIKLLVISRLVND